MDHVTFILFLLPDIIFKVKDLNVPLECSKSSSHISWNENDKLGCAAEKAEVFVFVNMRRKAFGIQLFSKNTTLSIHQSGTYCFLDAHLHTLHFM